MALTSTRKDADGVVRKASGFRSGSRTAADWSIDLGFEPRRVRVVNLTDRVSAEWFEDFGDTKQLTVVAAGTTTWADAGISVDGNTFTVDVSVVGLETDNDDVYWEAEGQ